MRLFATVLPSIAFGIRGGLNIRSGGFGGIAADEFQDGTGCSKLVTLDDDNEPFTWTFVNQCYEPSTQKCTCPPNSELTGPIGDTYYCTLENGCKPENNDQCDPNATCANLAISDMMQDNNGVKECKPETTIAYECTCKEGYAGDGFATAEGCRDADECLEDPCGDIHPAARCTNLDITNGQTTPNGGRYSCYCLGEGHFYMAQRNEETGNLENCGELDKCQEASPCGTADNVICTDVTGHGDQDLESLDNSKAYICSCETGYQWKEETQTCEDIDECAGDNSCSDNGYTQCVNSEGSYVCDCETAVYEGGEMVDNACVPKTECSDMQTESGCMVPIFCEHPIPSAFVPDVLEPDANAECQENGYEPYVCECKTGWTKGSEGRCDQDINECEDSPCPEFATCSNTDGTYFCECPDGYENINDLPDDAPSCIDVNECDDPGFLSFCSAKSTCQNCARHEENCSNGYNCLCDSVVVNGAEVVVLEIVEGACIDINECVTGGVCAADQTCENRDCLDEDCNGKGGFTCGCVGGRNKQINFINGQIVETCEDDNECETLESNKCNYHAGQRCVNLDTKDLIYDCSTEYTNEEGKCMYNCECGLGMIWDGILGKCVDMNECDDIEDLCGSSPAATCTNVDAEQVTSEVEIGGVTVTAAFGLESVNDGFVCSCDSCDVSNAELFQSTENVKVLYDVEYTGGECIEILPCEGSNKCDVSSTTCEPARYGECPDGRGYTCKCQPGFQEMADWTKCEDIQECTATPDICGSATGVEMSNEPSLALPLTCDETQGSYKCSCPAGYKLKAGDCMAEEGSLDKCICEALNDCEDNACGENTECVELPNFVDNVVVPDNYQCDCRLGYVANSDLVYSDIGKGVDCYNADECTLPTEHPAFFTCPDNSSCADTEGSYTCSCNDGWEMNNEGVCVDYKECRDPNLVLDDQDTRTIFLGRPDECNLMTTTCVEGIAGGGSTCECKAGLQFATDDEERVECVDIDECADGTDNCHGNANCTNVYLGFECACDEGYEGDGSLDGTGCVNIDECEAEVYPCGANEDCQDSEGSFLCSCSAGFEKKEGATECTDINECQDQDFCNDYSFTECENSDGAAVCKCLEGYVREAGATSLSASCVTETNCVDGFACMANAHCVEKEGVVAGVDNSGVQQEKLGYSCECNDNWEYDAEQGACVDINECLVENGGCVNADCENHEDGYSCNCHTGFEKKDPTDLLTCTDIDECGDPTKCWHLETGTNADLQECRNTDGDYECDCISGTTPSCDEDGCKCVNVDECGSAETNNCPENSKCIDQDFTVKNDNDDRIKYVCECVAGYEDVDFICENINECEGDPCPEFSVCTDYTEVPGYTCDCQNGYFASFFDTLDQFSPAIYNVAGHCEPLNECTEGGHDCFSTADEKLFHVNEICEDITPGWTCSCPENTVFEEGKGCVDINECLTECIPDDVKDCVDKKYHFDAVTHECNCKTGFEDNGPNACKDTDECALSESPCTGFGSQCTNNFGSYDCACNEPGTKLEDGVCVNIDECTEGTSSCDQICTDKTPTQENQGESGRFFVCSCNEGYTLNEDGQTCDNIDECNPPGVGVDPPCDVNAECKDSEGSFSCTCNAGWTGDTSVTGLSDSPCVNLNECETNQHSCQDPNGYCFDTEGSYSCLCQFGYEKNNEGVCVNINECEIEAHNCRPGAVCVDLEPNDNDLRQPFECVCKEDEGQATFTGFDVSGAYITCSDADECENNSHRCHQHASCDNQEWNGTEGQGYSCTCKAGYTAWTEEMGEFDDSSHLHADPRDVGPVCVNIDECVEGGHDCDANAKCTDTDGGWECKCKRGYTGTGQTCMDYNECSEGLQPNLARRIRGNDPHDLCPANSDCMNLSLLDGEETGYNCVCREGYKVHTVSDEGIVEKCTNINECEATDDNRHNCNENATCEDTAGSYTCTCNTGFEGNGVDCQDILECDTDVDDCDANATCGNTVGSFTCSCNSGYEGDGKTCENINECSAETHQCDVSADCEDTEGSYLCHCFEGYSGNGRTCTDINECLLGGDNDCDANAKCTNNAGSFACECMDGYEGVDGTECTAVDYCALEATNSCANQGRATCTNVDKVVTVTYDDKNVGTWLVTGQGYECACSQGYEGDGETCTNVDECANGTDDCDDNATCTDNEGGWSCKCNDFWEGTGQECSDIDECAQDDACQTVHADGLGQPVCENNDNGYACLCPNGYKNQESNDKVCANFDECLDDPCDANASCQDTVGSFTCTCNAGYEGSGLVCTDINECETGDHNCVNANCENNVGSYACDCLDGYKDGPSCVDVDECDKETGDNNCDVALGKCLNFNGGFECKCIDGYEGNGVSCTDIDECTAGSHNCGANTICTNDAGSFSCACQTGYEGVPEEGCTDINECFAGNNCDANASCENNEGSYSCSCNDGYNGNGVSCEDIDECAENTDDCGANSLCTNATPHTDDFKFTCACDDGYEPLTAGDARECTDIDECQVGTHKCSVYGTCTNSDGAYACSCNAGWEGDGFVCTDVDECGADNVCGIDASCSNEDGGYECDCPEGYSKDIVTEGTRVVQINCYNNDECQEDNACHEHAICTDTNGSYTCSCKEGFYGDGYYGKGRNGCTDVDECNDNPCDVNAVCANNVGSFTCTCCDGWSGSGLECFDINECNENNRRRRDLTAVDIPDSVCHESGHCINLNGTFDCACDVGFTGDGFSCENVNECELENDCDVNATCDDTEGSYTCTCNTGYQGSGTGCTNINECDKNPCDLDATCKDNAGSYTCECNSGFTGDGKTCTDDNECIDGTDDCHAEASCNNVPGSFECSCNAGFEGDGVNCKNIDECANGTDNCDNNASCTDNYGSFDCACNKGFLGSGVECEDENECDSSPCSEQASCENNVGSYSCTCNAGYSGDGKTCTDIDECAAEVSPCDVNANCDNLSGSHTCTCNSGWESQDNGVTCYNINECDRETDNCHEELATCTDNAGSFQCACITGYVGDGVDCNDKDECAESPCSENAACSNSDGSYSCACNEGYEGNGFECTDINECTEGTHNCDPDATCENVDASFTCTCNAGYSGEGTKCTDDNECVSGDHTCSQYASCTNNPGGYDCACNAGFTGDGEECIDNNECTNGENNCHADANCDNLPGTFACSCKEGFSGDGLECVNIDECATETDNCADHATCSDNVGSYECTCNAGYQGSGFECENINECEEGTHTCVGELIVCDDKTPGYNCRCPDGYENDAIFGTFPQQYRCLDLDECAHGKDTCDDHATCTNNAGSYSCQCNTGFSGDGFTCEDIDECEETPCHEEATCTNSIGSFSCECNSGWSGTGFQCTDIDECLASISPKDNCDDNAYCTNIDGSFTCECKEGFTGDGVTCVNVDECLPGQLYTHNCHKDGYCEDTFGSYNCFCNEGYRSSDDGRTCSDINECDEGKDNCDANAKCDNSKGSFSCECNDGYSGDGEQCENIDECANSDLNNCSSHAICSDTNGGFTCTCINGYTAGANDGVECLNNDECATDETNTCSRNAECTDQPGSYSCACVEGYEGDGHTCTDVNECNKLDACDVNASCVNSVGSFECTCNEGWTGDGQSCTNIDECSNDTQECDVNAACTDNQGSYTCACTAGYDGDGFTCRNVDECASETDNCDDNATCTDSVGSFSCECNNGWSGDGTTCEDVDECATTDVCDRNAACANSLGSFFCTCQDGWANTDGEASALPGSCVNVNECLADNNCDQNAACSDTQGSYTCTCLPGYEGSGLACANINECLVGTHSCDENAACTDNTGSFDCSCNDGWSGDGVNCEDVLECANEDACGANTNCIELPGSYDCECALGYKGNAFEGCVDIDECVEGNQCDVNSDCTNNVGSYTCACHVGYTGNGRECEDDNECELETHNCTGPNASCNNLPGTYDCSCPQGYTQDAEILPGNEIRIGCVDMNECAMGADNCDRDHGSCVNKQGGFECVCAVGYAHREDTNRVANIGIGINDGLTCVDVDECATESHECSEHGSCSNTVGSYECSCNEGFTGDGKSCIDFDECARELSRSSLVGPDSPFCDENAFCENRIGGYTCTCNSGYSGDGFSCFDLNECETGAHECSNNGACSNSVGSYDCECNQGWSGDGFICEDVNECDDSPCDQNANCENTPGNFECGCNEGYSGDGFSCSDINECDIEGSCGANTTCANNDGSYECSCLSGYDGDAVQGCSDINECDSAPCHEKAVCSNSEGSFSCTCGVGFSGNGFDCSDIDECNDQANVPENSSCENTHGSFIITCDSGFVKNENGTCDNINECLTGNVCEANSDCVDTVGSFRCDCHSGFNKVDNICTDIDECFEGSHQCDANATCDNRVGSYDCTCNDGYSGTGKECSDINECEAMLGATHGSIKACHANGECSNSEGSYTCTCSTGYEGDGFDCEDINECDDGNTCSDVPHSTCVNSQGTFDCACNNGWLKNESGQCANINECATFDSCTVNSVCVDNDGSFNCVCNEGYQQAAGVVLKPTDVVCEDVNECLTAECPTNGFCVNEIGSYYCDCNDGFEGDACVDIKECSAPESPCDSNAVCIEQEGSFDCKCNTGYTGDGFTCADINECVEQGAAACGANADEGDADAGCTDINECDFTDCGENAYCENYAPGHECKCDTGFEMVGGLCVDINECLTVECGSNQKCVNSSGSYACVCETGYASSTAGEELVCSNINECNNDSNNCNENATCFDTEGSFLCKCNEGYNGDGVECVDIDECLSAPCNAELGICENSAGSYSCSCIAGYSGDGVNCVDIDECAAAVAKLAGESCDGNALCTNTQGGFTCECNAGYEGNGFSCTDIDECETGTNECSTNAECFNAPGTYSCACNNGFTGDGKSCVDDCEIESTCEENFTCSHGEDGFAQCDCINGYHIVDSLCVDIDECESEVDTCDANSDCKNTQGGYLCTCHSGYEGSGHVCENINECLSDEACPENSSCIDNVPGHSCKALPGYEPFIIGNELTFVDIDECAIGTHTCHELSTCSNMAGSFDCNCDDETYSKDADGACVRDECALELDNCGANTDCTDTLEGFTCSCKEGFFGNNDGASGADCAPNSNIETMPELAQDVLQAFIDHFVESGKSGRIAKLGNAATKKLKNALGKANGKADRGMECLANVSAETIAAVSAELVQAAEDLQAGVITDLDEASELAGESFQQIIDIFFTSRKVCNKYNTYNKIVGKVKKEISKACGKDFCFDFQE